MAELSTKQKQREAILESLRNGTSRLGACGAAGICTSTLSNWSRADDAFREALAIAEQTAIQTAEDHLFARATDKEDPKSATCLIFWLKNRAGWVDSHALHHSGSIDTRSDFLGALVAAGQAVQESQETGAAN